MANFLPKSTMKRIFMPDGNAVNFPDDMPVEEIQLAMPKIMEQAKTTKARMADAKRQGYNTDLFHGTMANDIDEFDPNLGDIGTHLGTAEQASNRLQHVANGLEDKSSFVGRTDLPEGANILPVKAAINKPLVMQDVGGWNDATQVAAELEKFPEFKDISDLMSDALEAKGSYEADSDWIKSPENRALLDEIRGMIEFQGYDSIKYKNLVENTHFDKAADRPGVAKRRQEITQEVQEIEERAFRGKGEAPSMEDEMANPGAIQEFLDAPHEAPEYSPGDEARLLELETERVGMKRAQDDDAFSYISLDPSNIRSTNAQFNPKDRSSANLLASATGATILTGAAVGGSQNVEAGTMDVAGRIGEATGRRIGDLDALPGQPSSANIPGVGKVDVGGSSQIQDSARAYSEATGIPLAEVTEYMNVDPDFAENIAREFDLMKHDPSNPVVKESYQALADETLDQYKKMIEDGVTPYFIKGDDPYKNSPYESLLDLTENKRLGVFPTKDGFGNNEGFDPANNPLLGETGLFIDGEPVLYNDAFRAVHDYYGHGKQGVGFRAAGEENAYQAHSGMYSDKARRAAATETRGQNSWLNFGEFGESNKTAGIDDTVFADQKTGLLPNWAVTQRTKIADERRKRFFENVRSDESGGGEGLAGAIDADGRIKLTHYSRKPLERIDPAQYGKGLSGKTIAEKNRASDPNFVDRSFYAMEGTDNAYKLEAGLGGAKNSVELPIEQIYDIANDPDNLKGLIDKKRFPSPQEQATQIEKLISEKGYSGFYNRSSMGDIASIFDPLDSGKRYSISVPGIGESLLLTGLFAAGATQSQKVEAKGIIDTLATPANLRKLGFLTDKGLANPTSVKGAVKKYRALMDNNPAFRDRELGRYQNPDKFTDIAMPDRKIIDPASLKDRALVPVSGDPSRLGRQIHTLGGVDLDVPVDVQGGYRFPEFHEGDDIGWASMADAAKKKQKNFDLAHKETGRDVTGVYTAMGNESINFSTPIAKSLQLMTTGGKVTKKNRKAFDADLRNHRPEWVGIDHPDALDQLLGQNGYPAKAAGKLRSTYAKRMSLAKYRDQGFPAYNDVFEAAVDPALSGASPGSSVPVGSAGMSMFDAIPGEDVYKFDKHRTYDTAIPGQYRGGFEESVPPDVMYPETWDMLGKMKNKKGKPFTHSQKTGSFVMNPKLYEVADQKWVDSVSKYLEDRKKYIAGGLAVGGVGGANASQMEEPEPFVHNGQKVNFPADMSIEQIEAAMPGIRKNLPKEIEWADPEPEINPEVQGIMDNQNAINKQEADLQRFRDWEGKQGASLENLQSLGADALPMIGEGLIGSIASLGGALIGEDMEKVEELKTMAEGLLSDGEMTENGAKAAQALAEKYKKLPRWIRKGIEFNLSYPEKIGEGIGKINPRAGAIAEGYLDLLM